MNITIKTIPQKEQRYETIGDYWWDTSFHCPKCNKDFENPPVRQEKKHKGTEVLFFWICPKCKGEIYPQESLSIRVSDIGNWKYEALVALHEFIEVMLCKDREISELDIMAFDKAFEASKKVSPSAGGGFVFVESPGLDDEPGDDPKAPYGKEHRFAENLERLFAAELGIIWAGYDADLCKICHAHD